MGRGTSARQMSITVGNNRGNRHKQEFNNRLQQRMKTAVEQIPAAKPVMQQVLPRLLAAGLLLK